MEAFIIPLHPRLVRCEKFLAHVGRVSHHHIKPTLLEYFRKRGLPIEGFGMDGGITDDAVSLTDAVIQAGEGFAVGGGLDPQAELANLDGLGIEVRAVEIVLEDLAVGIEEGALATQLFETGVGDFVIGVELVEGLDEECARVAGGIEDAEAFEDFLLGFPKFDERLALGIAEGFEVVGIRIRQRLASGGGGRGFFGYPQSLEAGSEHGTQRLLNDVTGDEGRGVKGTFLFPPDLASFLVTGGSPLSMSCRMRSRSVMGYSKMWPRMFTVTSLAKS